MMDSETRETLVGAGVVLLLVLFGIFAYGRDPNSGGYEVNATFKRIDGLTVGSEVLLGGVKIGSIIRQGLNEHFQPVVTMRISGEFQLPRDTSAAVHTDGLFGSKFISLEPGGDMDNIEPGGAVALTQDAVIVSELMELIISEGKAVRRREAKAAVE